MKSGLTPLQAKVLREANELLDGLKPGDAFPSERVLAKRSKVGRAVVRGMLATLQQDGYVVREGHRWTLLRRIPEPPASHEGTKRQRAKDFLLAELSSGRLRPGDQISALALARKIGVATISMREALLEMMPLGILTKKERQKWEVATFGDNRIKELREFREMVEIFSLRKFLASGLSPEKRKALEAHKAEAALLLKQEHPAIPDILATDLSFHRMLLTATENSLLEERANFIYLIIEFQLVSPFFTVENGKLGLTQHSRILDAMLDGDRAVAERHLIQHLRSAEQTFCAIVHRFRK
jgi:DNA-binding GntR family transcriptional regulator